MRIDIHHHHRYSHSAAIFSELQSIGRLVKQIMSKQAQFDLQIGDINTKLDGIGSSIESERQQISDFIAANPAVDTSALQGVSDRLSTLGDSVGGIFEPAAEAPAEEAPAPVADETEGTDETAGETAEESGESTEEPA